MELFLVKNVPKLQNLSKHPIKISRIAKRENYVLHNRLESFIYNKNPRAYVGWQKKNQNEKFDQRIEEPTTKTLIIVPDPIPITDEPIQFLRPPPPPKNKRTTKKHLDFSTKGSKKIPKKVPRYSTLLDESEWKPMGSGKFNFEQIPGFHRNFEGTSAFKEMENHLGFKVQGNKMVPISVMEKIPFRYVPF